MQPLAASCIIFFWKHGCAADTVPPASSKLVLFEAESTHLVLFNRPAVECAWLCLDVCAECACAVCGCSVLSVHVQGVDDCAECACAVCGCSVLSVHVLCVDDCAECTCAVCGCLC